MEYPPQARQIVRFGLFEVDLKAGELHKHGLKIPLQEQPFRLLALLLERHGEVVSREELRQALWPEDTFVDFERGLNTAVKKLRHALGDVAEQPRYIATHYKRGYRFIPLVEDLTVGNDPVTRCENVPEIEGTPTEVEHVSGVHLRWRVVAVGVAITGLAVVGYLSTRRPASLLVERDSVVIADFDNQTGDEVFDGTLRQALLSQMGQSPYLSIVSEERIQSILSSMARTSSDGLPRPIAREVCQRVGGKALLIGSVGNLGNRYFVGLEAVGCAGGETLANEYEEAESRERVLAALSRAVSKIRAGLGESLASVRRLSAPAEATTPSLEALRAYSLALAEQAVGNNAQTLFERAIELDSEFAAPYLRLAEMYHYRGEELKAEEAISRAFALRGKTSERERLDIEGSYHWIASGDLEQAIAAGSLAAQLYPDDGAARRILLGARALAGDPDEALRMAQREVELAPDEVVSYHTYAHFLILFGRTAEAASLLDQARARGLRPDRYPVGRYMIAALDGNSAAMEREAGAALGKPSEHLVLMLETQVAGYFGRLGKARDIARKAATRQSNSAPAIAATVALTEAVFGLEKEARSRAKAAIELDRGRRTLATSALALALTNECASAEAILGDLLRRYPNDTLLNSVWVPAVKGAIALRQGDPRQALEATEAPMHTSRFAWPAYVRGTAYLELGLGPEAAAEFRKVVERRRFLFASTYVYGAAFAYPVAQLGLARALAMSGEVEASRKVYEEFLAEWNNADPDIPILIRARRERSIVCLLDPQHVGELPRVTLSALDPTGRRCRSDTGKHPFLGHWPASPLESDGSTAFKTMAGVRRGLPGALPTIVA